MHLLARWSALRGGCRGPRPWSAAVLLVVVVSRGRTHGRRCLPRPEPRRVDRDRVLANSAPQSASPPVARGGGVPTRARARAAPGRRRSNRHPRRQAPGASWGTDPRTRRRRSSGSRRSRGGRFAGCARMLDDFCVPASWRRPSRAPAGRLPTWRSPTRWARRPRSPDDGPTSGGIDAALGQAAYRIVEEAIRNARVHAGSVPVHVLVVAEGSALRIEVENEAGP